VIVTGGWTAAPSAGYSDDVMSAPYAAGADPDDSHSADRRAGERPAEPPEDDEPPGYDDLPEYAAAVLDVVELVPAGQVVTYGDVAAFLGRGGPRQVGHVMSHWGGAVAWWRVLRADGSPAPGLESEALAHYRRERTPLRPGGQRVDLRLARWAGER
jgi:alkylated DNA nucleotide flippase Atl1